MGHCYILRVECFSKSENPSGPFSRKSQQFLFFQETPSHMLFSLFTQLQEDHHSPNLTIAADRNRDTPRRDNGYHTIHRGHGYSKFLIVFCPVIFQDRDINTVINLSWFECNLLGLEGKVFVYYG